MNLTEIQHAGYPALLQTIADLSSRIERLEQLSAPPTASASTQAALCACRLNQIRRLARIAHRRRQRIHDLHQQLNDLQQQLAAGEISPRNS